VPITAADTEMEVVVSTTTSTNANFNAHPPAIVKQKAPAPQRPPPAVTGELFPCRICGKLVKLLSYSLL